MTSLGDVTPLEVTVLLRIGDGAASPIGSFPVPLRAVIVGNDGDFSNLSIQVDLELINEGLRAALSKAADVVPGPWDNDAERTAEREERLRLWDAAL